jgi:hypothetical protein
MATNKNFKARNGLEAGGTITSTNLNLTDGYPTVSPSLVLDFAKSQSLDSRITFTRASTATYVGPDGLLETAAINAPRFECNPVTKECLGLLIESSRTNMLLYSSDLSNAVWNQGATLSSFFTPSVSSIIAPDGTSTARQFVSTSTTTQGLFLRQYITLSATMRRLSVYVYVPTQSGVTDWSLVADAADVDSATGSTSTVFDAWVRYEINITTTASRAFLDFNLRFNGVAPTTAGATIHVWGPQLEAGNYVSNYIFASSYIPTAATAVTRPADFVSITGTTFDNFFNQSEGTFISVFDVNNIATGSWSRVWQIGNGTNWMASTQNGTNGTQWQAYNYVSNVAQFSFLSNSTLVQNYQNRVVVGYKTNDFAAIFNNETINTDTSGSVPVLTTSAMYIGCNDLPYSDLNGHIAQIIYYPKRLTDAQLQLLAV